MHFASTNGHLEVVAYLLRDSGANIDAVTNEKESALDLSKKNEKENIVRLLSHFMKNKS